MVNQSISSNPDNSVFVAASAGSGKTTVLTNRVLRLLFSGANPSKILCLTFTKVAANQMQNRILSKLEEWVLLDDEKLKIRLTELTDQNISNSQIASARKLFAKLLDDPYGIQISTIHSFCQSIIQKFPIEAKSVPNFVVIDEQKEDELLRKARNKLLTEALNNKLLADKISLISSKLNEESFLEISSQLLRKRSDLAFLKEKYFDVAGVIEALFKRAGLDPDENELSVLNDFILDEDWQKEKLLELCQSTEIKSKSAITNFIQNPNFSNLEEYFDVFLKSSDPGEPRQKLTTIAVQKQFSGAEELMLHEQARVLELWERLNTARIVIASAALIEIAYQIVDIYSNIKSQEGYLDYIDLIIKTNILLESSANREWIKYKLDGIYEHILVDESQDTNYQQWNIIKAITEEFFVGSGSLQNQNPTIFIVGDEKQSIYSFQGAEPDIFSNIFHYYREKLSLVNKKLLNVELSTSYRSFPTILQTVDKIFIKPELKSAISNLAPQIKHIAHKDKTSGKVEVLPVVVCQNTKQKDDEYRWELNFEENAQLKEREVLAKLITGKIKKLLEEKKFLASKGREIRFGDIMILLKERKSDLESLLVKNLFDAGIEAIGSVKVRFAKNIIVQDFLSLAKFILLPSDDLNLACLLKSPFFNISENELEKFCEVKNIEQISLFLAIKKTNKDLFLELEDLITQNQRQQFSIQEFFSHVLIYKKKQEEFLKSQSNAGDIIDHFFNAVISYQASNIGTSMQGFVHFVENSELEIKIDNFDQNQNKVYITTVHSSKGLEAPIVFIADAVHHSSKQARNNKRIFWEPNTHLPFWSQGKAKDNSDIKEIKKYEKEILKKEYWRQLYVAMTRAEEELYVCGYGERYDEDCWYQEIKNVLFDSAVKLNKSTYGEDFKDYLIGDGFMVGENYKPEDIQSEPLKAEIQIKNSDLEKLLNEIPNNELEEEFVYPSTLNNEDLTNQKGSDLGKLIHKIMEVLIKSKTNNSSDREDFIKHYLGNKISEEKIIKDIITRVNKVFEEFKELFNQENSQSEVPIIAKINNKIISGKIDFLVIRKDEVLIIDFKTGKPNDKQYQTQLDLYGQTLKKIYPDKEIKSQIIWI